MSEPVSILVPIRLPGDFSFEAEKLTSKGDSKQTAGAPPPLVLTMEQAARQLAIGKSTMYELVKSGQVESIMIGRLRRIPAAALAEFVARLRGVA